MLYHFETYYEILGLSYFKRKQYTPKVIKKAYYSQALRYHPDKVCQEQRTLAEDKFKTIGQAYEILYNSQKKKEYDLNLESDSLIETKLWSSQKMAQLSKFGLFSCCFKAEEMTETSYKDARKEKKSL